MWLLMEVDYVAEVLQMHLPIGTPYADPGLFPLSEGVGHIICSLPRTDDRFWFMGNKWSSRIFKIRALEEASFQFTFMHSF